MPQKLLNRATGNYDLVDDADVASALASDKYVAPDAVAVHRVGEDTYVAPEQVQRDRGLTEVIDPARVASLRGHAIREKQNTGIAATGKALLGGAISGASAGFLNPFEDAQEFNQGVAFAGNVAGAFLPGLIGDDAGFAALAADPVEAEQAAATLSSKFLYANETGAEAGSVARSAERGLKRAGVTLDEAKAAAHTPVELATLDSAGLKAAREAEETAIEAARAPQRTQLVEDLGAHASALKNDEKIFLATKGIKEAALPGDAVRGSLKIQEIGKISLEADGQVNRLLRNPIRLAEKPELAIGALQQQENALVQLGKRESTLRQMFAADTSGERAAALDRLPSALERNRALQTQIRQLTAAPTSERLAVIDAAKEALKSGGGQKSLAESMLGGSIMGHIAGAFSGMPIIGPMLGAKAGQLATDLVFGRLGKATAAASERGAAAVAKFLDVSKRAAPTLGVLATKTLARVAYAPKRAPDGDTTLAGLFHARTKEIKSQTMYGPDGSTVLRPEARAAMASKLAPIRAVSPIAADKMESLAARRLAFLSSKIPRRPEIAGMQLGPDNWKPSDMEMRQFARYAAAVEDPTGVVERLANGTITPEDAEAMRAVYPETMASIQAAITQQLPTLHKTLPYERRVALSIFSGVPVDPAMRPEILAVLQSQFESEPGSDGGMQQPQAAPQFGSISKPDPTPAQARTG